MSYEIGDIFTGLYRPEISNWCDQNGCVIVEIEPVDGLRRFEIRKAEVPVFALINELRAKITDTDYKVIKCYEYSMAGQELPYDIAKLHAERQVFRDEINRLEQLL